jgi:hypothetical protein
VVAALGAAASPTAGSITGGGAPVCCSSGIGCPEHAAASEMISVVVIFDVTARA